MLGGVSELEKVSLHIKPCGGTAFPHSNFARMTAELDRFQDRLSQLRGPDRDRIACLRDMARTHRDDATYVVALLQTQLYEVGLAAILSAARARGCAS